MVVLQGTDSLCFDFQGFFDSDLLPSPSNILALKQTHRFATGRNDFRLEPVEGDDFAQEHTWAHAVEVDLVTNKVPCLAPVVGHAQSTLRHVVIVGSESHNNNVFVFGVDCQ